MDGYFHQLTTYYATYYFALLILFNFHGLRTTAVSMTEAATSRHRKEDVQIGKSYEKE
jgi:hypothetical protein